MARPDPPALTAGQVATLRDLHAVAAQQQLAHSLMLIGATARLLQLDWPLNLTTRTTADLDFVMQVNDWAEHGELMNSAVAAGFEQKPEEHRLYHSASGTLVDLVPFGRLEKPEGTIKWPGTEHEMSVWGLREAEETAVHIEIAPGLSVRVVTLPCLVALKLFAWRDRRWTDKGAGDLRDADFILSHCCDLPEYEQLAWNAYAAVTELPQFAGRLAKFDFAAHAGAAVMGAELQHRLRKETRQNILPVLVPLTSDLYGVAIEQLLNLQHDADEAVRATLSLRYEILSYFLRF